MNFFRYMMAIMFSVLFGSVAFAQVMLSESQFDAGSKPMESKTHRMSSTMGQVFMGNSAGVLNLQTRAPMMVSLAPRTVVGDVDGDGLVAFQDALIVLQFVLGFQTPTGVQEAIADADGDGQLTIGDAIFILRLAQGLETASKPVVASKPVMMIPEVIEEEGILGSARVVRLVFDSPASGGDLRFSYPLEIIGTRVDVIGLSDAAVSSIQTEVPGVIRIGFVQPMEAKQGIVLQVTMPGVDVSEAVQIGLDGVLYGIGSQGQVRLETLIDPAAPRDYALHQNMPNPFNPETTIFYALPDAGFVTLDLYDVTGQLVRHLVSQQMDGGRYEVRWDGRDGRGHQVSSGIYFYRIEVANGQFSAIRRMVLLK